MLQLAEWGHSVWFGRLSPHGMVQPKYTQSLVPGASASTLGCLGGGIEVLMGWGKSGKGDCFVK